MGDVCGPRGSHLRIIECAEDDLCVLKLHQRNPKTQKGAVTQKRSTWLPNNPESCVIIDPAHHLVALDFALLGFGSLEKHLHSLPGTLGCVGDSPKVPRHRPHHQQQAKCPVPGRSPLYQMRPRSKKCVPKMLHLSRILCLNRSCEPCINFKAVSGLWQFPKFPR